MRSWILAIAAAVCIVASAEAAEALRCKQWKRLLPQGKTATIYRMIDDRLNSNAAKQHPNVDRFAIRECLEPLIPRMVGDFNSICAQGQRVSMDALDKRFDKYFFSCLGPG